MIHIEMLLDFELRIVVNLSWNKDPGYCPGYGEYIVKKKKTGKLHKATFIDYNALFRNQQRNETLNCYTQTLKSLRLVFRDNS